MEVTVREIADYVHGEIVGDENVKVSSVAKIESGKPGAICFLANPKYEHHLYTCKASIILINSSFEPKGEVSATLIKVENAYEAVASLLDMLNAMKSKNRFTWLRSVFARNSKAFSAKVGRGTYRAPFTYIGERAKVGKNCYIYPQVYIGDNVEIGDNVILYPGVKIYQGCKIGNNCILHANCVVGSDGFGFAPTADGTYKKIPQTGIVIIEDNCEVGANTAIDRATMGATVIGSGVKSIGQWAFDQCSKLTSVYYKGSASEWSNISISYANAELTEANRYYYSAGQPTDNDYTYWRYVDGVATVWQ